MQRRYSRHTHFPLLVFPCLLLALLFTACGGASSGQQQQRVNLKFVSWIGGDQLPVYQGVIKRFEAANPTIKVTYEVLPYDQLAAQLKARFNAGTAPDVMALFSGPFKDQFVNANDLVDLSQEPWVPNIVPNARAAALTSDQKKTVVMTFSLSAVAVVYNRQIFAKHNLAIPTTWDQFLQACEQLKQANIAPITMGAKDTWPLAYIPDLMTMQTVYKNNPTFDEGLKSGKTTYAGSPEWIQALTDTNLLRTKGYLYKDILGTSYQDSEDLLASGKAAMTISGQFSVATAKKTNPTADLGLFPLPYGSGKTVATGIDVTLGIASSSKHIAEAKKFLQFWADSENANQYLNGVGSFPTFTQIKPPTDSALQQLLPAIQADSRDMSVITYPGTTNNTLEKGIQAMWAGTKTPQQVAQDMDKAVNS